MNVSNAVRDIHTWLHRSGMDCPDQHSFIDAYCSKLREAGLPVDRFFCGAVVLHPLIGARGWKWIDGIITDFEWARADMHRTPEETSSVSNEDLLREPPMMQLVHGAPHVRVKPTDDILPSDCDWMLIDGYTDLFGLPSPNTGKDDKLEGGFTWSTKAHAGFSDEHIEILQDTLLSFSTVLRYHIAQFNARSLLMIYLGEDAGSRVYGGNIERGQSLIIRSVVWFSDIRGFTKMSNELERTALVDLINGVFDITASVIRKYKGQTLKFMGDGLMAIFSSATSSFQRSSLTTDEKKELDEQEAAQLCHAARMAAAEVQCQLAQLRRQRQDQGLRGASVGIGLHYGDVSYGNVGAAERLDFTILGPAVNLASRTESLCSKLGAQVLCTQEFVDLDGSPDAWESRGDHMVKGVAKAVHVYELTCSPCEDQTPSSAASVSSASSR